MAFDADTWRAAHGYQPWVFRDGKYSWRAREVSQPQVAAFRTTFLEANAQGDERAATQELQRFLRLLFPGVFFFRGGDPVERILKLPATGIQELLNDFFAHKAGTTPRMATSSTPSWPAKASDFPRTTAEPATT
ncbi:MAG: hypothetical protein HOP28_09360 [Gemmatimonadales bacterium]|nr:hypothetical protein [Gemmatimonadales bacterium]